MNLSTYIRNDSGAVTVDWVVLTAAVVGLGMAVGAVVATGTEDLTGEVQAELASIDPGVGFLGWGSGGNSIWGSLSMLQFPDQATADDVISGALQGIYGGDFQAYYDAAMANINSGSHLEHEIDTIGALTALAAEQGVTIDTDGDMSYQELHAAYQAGTLS